MSQDPLSRRGRYAAVGARKEPGILKPITCMPSFVNLNDLKVDYIYSESFSQDHLGQAIMNRLSKAAGYQIYKV